MSQDWISIGKDHPVKDDPGDTASRIDGHVFSIGDELEIYDGGGDEQAVISQKLRWWGRTYEVWRGDERFAVVKKSIFTMFRCEITIDVPGPDELVAEGNYYEHEYELRRGKRLAACVSWR